MIKIRTRQIDSTASIYVSGHSGTADIGHDIVCAAASILLYTAAQAVNDMYAQGKLRRKPTITIKNGYGGVSCTAKKDYTDEVRHTYCVVMTGFKLLAHNYPKYVVIT